MGYELVLTVPSKLVIPIPNEFFLHLSAAYLLLGAAITYALIIQDIVMGVQEDYTVFQAILISVFMGSWAWPALLFDTNRKYNELVLEKREKDEGETI